MILRPLMFEASRAAGCLVQEELRTCEMEVFLCSGARTTSLPCCHWFYPCCPGLPQRCIMETSLPKALSQDVHRIVPRTSGITPLTLLVLHPTSLTLGLERGSGILPGRCGHLGAYSPS